MRPNECGLSAAAREGEQEEDSDMADTRPGRDLVVCCDGTNNTLTAGLQDTNVLLLYAYLRKHVPASTLLYYDPGVGTPDAAPPTDLIDMAKRKIERIAGLAAGRGVY